MHYIETSQYFENTRTKYAYFLDIYSLDFTYSYNALPTLSPNGWIWT